MNKGEKGDVSYPPLNPGLLVGLWRVSRGLLGGAELGDELDQAGDDVVSPAYLLAVQFFAPPERSAPL